MKDRYYIEDSYIGVNGHKYEYIFTNWRIEKSEARGFEKTDKFILKADTFNLNLDRLEKWFRKDSIIMVSTKYSTIMNHLASLKRFKKEDMEERLVKFEEIESTESESELGLAY